MKVRSNIIVSVIAILLVACLGIVFLIVGNQGGTNAPSPAPTLIPEQAAVPAPQASYAASGELVQGFPSALILDSGAKVSDSYSLGYNAGLDQYTAIFNSNQSLADLYASYQSYFSQNGWTITNQITKYPTSRGVYAQKDKNDASVAIFDETTTRQVTVSYVVR